jgi:hypothetical protein
MPLNDSKMVFSLQIKEKDVVMKFLLVVSAIFTAVCISACTTLSTGGVQAAGTDKIAGTRYSLD